MKSAVEFLVETLAENGILHSSDIEQTKEMEKRQIAEAFEEAMFHHQLNGLHPDEYYNETLKDNI